MRPKYKLGQFIQTKAGEGEVAQTGVIDSVVLRETAVSYTIPGNDTEIEEDEIAAVFRPVTPRKPKALGEKAAKKSGGKAARAA